MFHPCSTFFVTICRHMAALAEQRHRILSPSSPSSASHAQSPAQGVRLDSEHSTHSAAGTPGTAHPPLSSNVNARHPQSPPSSSSSAAPPPPTTTTTTTTTITTTTPAKPTAAATAEVSVPVSPGLAARPSVSAGSASGKARPPPQQQQQQKPGRRPSSSGSGRSGVPSSSAAGSARKSGGPAGSIPPSTPKAVPENEIEAAPQTCPSPASGEALNAA
jgi:hypothetical protein